MHRIEGGACYRPAWKTCKHYLRLGAENMGKMFEIIGIFRKSDIFLDNIVIASKLMSGFFSYEN